MSELVFKGNQKFMDKEIPIIYGGFGEKQKCISDKTIAELHKMDTFKIRERITNNIKRFKESVDFIDLKIVIRQEDNNLLSQIGYTNMEVGKSNHIYILSKRGYAKLIKIFDTDLAWEVYEKLLDEYFYLKKQEETIYPKLPTTYIEALKQLVSSVEENGRLQEQLEEQEPKVIFADAVSASDKCILIRELAKYLKQNNVDIGEKRLYKWLRKEGYLIKVADDYNTPTQKSLNMGLFKIKKYTITNSQGEIIVKNTVMVTPKGQLYFTNKFLRNIKLENPRPVVYM